MVNPVHNDQNIKKGSEFKKFARKRIVGAVIVIIAVLWVLVMALDYFEMHTAVNIGQHTPKIKTNGDHKADAAHMEAEKKSVSNRNITAKSQNKFDAFKTLSASPNHKEVTEKETLSPSSIHLKGETQQPYNALEKTEDKAEGHAPLVHANLPKGVTFVEAVMRPMTYELNDRFWGWRPNDILNFTDNVNNIQLGTLEVTRRSAVQLAERISRTGSTDAFDPHLQNAMNWFMVKPERYWFPSPESKYKESLRELEKYKHKLLNGKASFYTRTDNLIPLLAAFEDLLGSCDENLIKSKEDDDSKVSFFHTDDYFYYAKGVAKAMTQILEAVHHDFATTLKSRNGEELLHHAIESCRLAASLSPWLICNGGLDGFVANHRANMAGPISHARFYLGQLIKTLST